MGPAGERIAAALHKVEGLHVQSADTMAEAVAVAASSLADGGVVLFSPAAPSFDRYANWAERSDDFVACAHALTTP
jgi:UDP-N-acetylmuramoylalanine--D-glutamate ligase